VLSAAIPRRFLIAAVPHWTSWAWVMFTSSFSLAPTRSLTHCASTRCTRRRGLRAEQPPATSERRRVSRPRPRLREPRQQRSCTATLPRPTRAGRGSVHHRAPASRRRPTRAAQRRRCGPRSTRPAHRAIRRARTRRQAPVIPAASSRSASRLPQSQSAAVLPALAVPTVADGHSDQFLLRRVIVEARHGSHRSASHKGRRGL
jgi:hypothetical protein